MAKILTIGQVMDSDVIPEEVKDLMVNVITRYQLMIGELLGSIELAYRRGVQDNPIKK